ncbi:MAG TPA: geranylgeranyl reductase family protein, partial [Blastocatellia bacterium]|nr:geranylgeranyl reductase family protein [Blastocatellia bacterium]
MALTNDIWDVAIAGAGPAGAIAAIHLAGRGHRVLLLDKDSFPRDKVCGDGLIADSIRCLKRAGLFEEVRRLGYETDTGTVFSPSRVEFDVPGQFLTLRRLLLDNLIVQKAIACGAAFIRARVARVAAQSDRTVRLELAESDTPLRAKIVLLATGASIDLASGLGLVDKTGPGAVALRCYVRSSLVIDRLVISYDRTITPGYAWIFPLGRGDYNVGCGIRYRESDRARVNLRQAYKDFVESFPLAVELMRQAESVTPLKGAVLRCGLKGARPLGPGNILVMGEMIGATFPFTGEGIGKAMETGEIAADISHRALSSGDFSCLSEFPDRIERELKPKYRGYILAEDWLSKPWLNDFLSRRVRRSRYLQESVAGIINETADPRKTFSIRGVLRSFLR